MKRKLLLIFSLLLCISGRAVDFEFNGVNYTIISDKDKTCRTKAGSYSTPGNNISGLLNLSSEVEYNNEVYKLVEIGKCSFSENIDITGSLTIPEGVTTIGESAFAGCSGFTGSLIIPKSVTTIGYSAFAECSGFNGSLIIPEGVTTIETSTFYGCSGFTGSLTIPKGVATIGYTAFDGCSGFNGSLIIPEGVMSIGEGAFDGCSGFTGSLTIPKSVKKIGGRAFERCSGFTGSLSIPEGITTIEHFAFSECSGFTGSLTLPESITTIELFAFNGCSGLTGSLTIGESVQTIGNFAFYQCKFSKVISYAKTPASAESYAFNNFYNSPLYVPAESVNLYKNTDEWKKFNYINPLSVEVTGISLNKSEINLLVGQEETLIATLTPEDASSEIVWNTDDNNNVISVDQNGKVTAIAKGAATVTATADDVSASCTVTVYGAGDVVVKPGEGTSEGDEDDTPGNNTEDGGSLVGNDLTLRVNQTAAIDLVIPEGLSVDPQFSWVLDNGGTEVVSMTNKDNTLSATFKGLKVGQTGYTVSIVGVNGNIESVKGKITVIAEIPMVSLEIDPASLSMAQNALPVKIKLVFTPDKATMPQFSWTSSESGVATVNQNGEVNPVSQGQTTITATVLDGSELSAVCKVTVTAPIDDKFELEFDDSVMGGVNGVTIYLGDEITLTPKAQEGYILPECIVWSSSDDSKVTVDQTGTVKGVGIGEATVTATATVNNEEVSASCKITIIPVPATGVEINVADMTLLVGQTDKLTASVTPDNTTDKTVTWTSDKPEIATVAPDGTVTAVSVGVATITATCGDVSATCKVTVKGSGDISIKPGENTDDLSINGNDVIVRINQTVIADITLPTGLSKPPTFEWGLGEDGSEFVSLSPINNTLSASFKGLKVGETYYTVSIANNDLLRGKVKVIAEVPMEFLLLEPSEISLAQNALPVKLETEYTPTTASMPQFNWSSSNPSVAMVNNEGIVTPKAVGQTTITAKALDGSELSADCKVTVTAPIAESFEFDFDESVMGGKEGISLYIGDTYQFTPKAQDGYVLPKVINWKSSDAMTVSVSGDGKVTALRLGEATITASAIVNGKEVNATCKVTVIPIKAQSIILSAEDLTMLIGQNKQLQGTVLPENTTDKTISWTISSGDGIVTVTGTGYVTAVSAGTATITASCGEVTAYCIVKVKSGDDIPITPGTGTGDGEDDGNGWIDGSDVYVHVNRTVNMNLSMPDGLTDIPTLTWTLAVEGDKFVKLVPAGNTLSAAFTGISVGETSYIVSLKGKELLTGKVTVIAEVTMKSLELEPAVLSMAQNALPVKLATKYTPSDATMPQFNWSSSNPEVASVGSDGTVIPKSQGQTTITATALDGSGLSATCEVTVTAPIDEDFEFDESVMGGVEGVTIFLGDSYVLKPKAHEGFVLPSNIVWSSSDDRIVSVDQNGKVTGNSLGSATIFATAVINGNEITASCTVNVVPIKVSSIKLSQTNAELRVSETLKLTATIEPDNATDKTLQWTTNAPSIVSVGQDGVVTAHMVGEANITARATDGSNVSANCTVKVVPTIATGITVTADGSTTLKATETVQLTATVTPATTTDKSVTWNSDKPDIASVSESGVVTAIAVGEANITATNSAGQSSTIKITVIPTLVETIELNRYTAQIRVQDGFRLTANIYPLTATDKSVTWSSSNPQNVSIDTEGNVLGIGLGEAQIICTANDGSGITAQCRVTVTTTATQSVSVTANGPTTLKASKTVQLTATVLPETASDKSVRWQSDNTDIATVDNRGLVTAVSVGSATITATNSGGQTASISITVVPTPVESIELNKTAATLKASETTLLIATVYPETATQKGIEWTSIDESIATVTQNGLVTAIAKGEAVITAKAMDGSGVTATCKVTVIATDVTSIQITANGSTTLKAAETLQLTATVLPETATDKSVNWSSASPEIADVNENGLVTAYAVGQTVITATASSDLKDEITITVEPTLVSSIILNQPSLTMRVTNEVQLSATILPTTATDKSLTWTSSNSSIASVDANGKVTAVKEGQASIICTTNDGSGVAATCIVNVVDTDVEIVTITASGPTTLKVSETVQLKATVQPETTTDRSITWSSGNDKVASVDDDGLVTAVSEGFAVITATTSNGLKDQITITVVDTQVSSITLNESTIILMANETYSLIPNIQPHTATNKQLHWSTGNASVATVAQDGIVSAIAVGETTVTASATDGSGVFASCKVTVIPTPAESITITVVGSTTLEINQTVQLTAEVLPANATDKSVVWTSSNKAIAEVTENGLVTALTAGETVITATNSAGQYDRVTIIVLSNEPEQPDVPDVPVKRADTPSEMLRKGDGTSHTFVAMMEKSDEVLETEGYRYVFGYTNASENEVALEDTPWRYTYTTEEIYWNSSYDFWVFAYYIDSEGTLCVSSRRHLDGSVDAGFDPMKFIGSRTRSGEHIVGIYTIEGNYMGKNFELLESGIYVIKTTNSSYKIIK